MRTDGLGLRGGGGWFHHAELRLQFDLQALQCAPQVIDLSLGRLD